ncbi:MAG: ABC transporter permease [Spirochaetales bacterium]|uniref:Autoinducer 2 import system permease protein LsrD n=1 Tax=Candidatus Thalassospirochaeta sargassi TaxID=3119039 RepID=A0AAJ1IGN8_9SPIO|nr:ABC transporter permease [Spirochaetales bacterium]
MANKTNKLKFLTHPTFILFLVFVALNLFFAFSTPRFFKLSNYMNIIRQSTMIMIVGCGCTFLMMTESLDLSVGSNLALSCMVYSFLVVFGIPGLGIGPLPLWAAGIIVLIIGGLIGVLNAVLVTRFDFEPFIATLGVMYIGRGLALATFDGKSIRTGFPDGFEVIGNDSILGVPYLFIFVFLAIVIFSILHKKTLLGKHAIAIGCNKNAAFFSGLNPKRIVTRLYIITGCLAAFAGILTASRLEHGDPRTGTGFEFTVLVAVLLGGTPLSGGNGTILGTVIGALIITVLGNGLNAMDILKFWQIVFKGIILIGAIVLHSQLRARRRNALIAAGTKA